MLTCLVRNNDWAKLSQNKCKFFVNFWVFIVIRSITWYTFYFFIHWKRLRYIISIFFHTIYKLYYYIWGIIYVKLNVCPSLFVFIYGRFNTIRSTKNYARWSHVPILSWKNNSPAISSLYTYIWLRSLHITTSPIYFFSFDFLFFCVPV